jgi:predicted O-linked N-acetylglucosamine transferase (SPINDLY family)
MPSKSSEEHPREPALPAGDAQLADLLRQVVALETQSRRIMLHLLSPSDHAYMILQADYRQQIQHLRTLLPESQPLLRRMSQAVETSPDEPEDILELITAWRQTVAKTLALGSDIMSLGTSTLVH